MTFNILYATARNSAGPWKMRRGLVGETIRQYAPDLIGLQEATDAQLGDISRDLPEYGVVAGPASGPSHLLLWAKTVSPALIALWAGLYWSQQNWPTVMVKWPSSALLIGAAIPLLGALCARINTRSALEEGEHCAILYRNDRYQLIEQGAFWLSRNPQRAGSVMPGTWLPRVANWAHLQQGDQGMLTVYNTHVDYCPWAKPGSVRILRNQLERQWDGAPQLLLGDFNATPRSAFFQRMLDRSTTNPDMPLLRDAWSEASNKEGPLETYHGGTGRACWRLRIDHIFFRGPMQVERVITIAHPAGDSYPSDHFAVVADLLPAQPLLEAVAS